MLYGLLAGITASLFSFIINNRVISCFGDKAVVLYIPIIEEFSKTYFAFAINGNIIFSHMVFGTVEAIYDLYNSPRKYSLTASMLSLLSHTVLGVIAFYAIKLSGSLMFSVLLSVIIHSLWNRFITG